jgi:hypothetical protein
MNGNMRWYAPFRHSSFVAVILLSMVFLESCDKEDPKPVSEPEVITTVQVTLVPDDSGAPVTLTFFDEDGEQGSIAPLITVSGSLKAGTTYSAVIELWNETVDPPLNVGAEVAEEANDHLFCFAVSGDVTINYEDQDDNGRPIGIITTWDVGMVGSPEVTVSLRHQPGTKSGECPGGGETDVQITFELDIV